MNKIPRIAITQGDTNGIGYELILKTFAEPEMLEIVTPIIYGKKMIANVHAEMLGIECRMNSVASAADAQENRINIVEVCDESAPVKLGTPTAESATMAAKALKMALEDADSNVYDALVIAPSEKNGLKKAMEALRMPMEDVQQPETSEEPAENATAKDAAHKDAGAKNNVIAPMVLTVNEMFGVASVAGKLTAEEAMQTVTEDNIIEKATILRNILRRDLRVDGPRIAVMAFGETVDNAEGSRDMDVIAAATEKLRTNGVVAFGPYSVAELQNRSEIQHFDGILGMYDGQVAKLMYDISGDECAVLASGLTKVVTAPVQGVSFDKAGKNVVEENSMRKAVYMAVDATRSRRYYDLPLRNPLKKIYHERREDGEKARFAVKREFKPKEEK